MTKDKTMNIDDLATALGALLPTPFTLELTVSGEWVFKTYPVTNQRVLNFASLREVLVWLASLQDKT